MLNIIVGHRGTGKSEWLNLVERYYKDKQIKITCFDLDKEVEKASGKSVFDLFNQSEQFFRDWEGRIFRNLVKDLEPNQISFISVGAGFCFEKNPLWNVIFLCRQSDKDGRIFLDRPRLSQQDPLTEYKSFYKKRKIYYLEIADEVLYRREHFKKLELSDLLFLGLKTLPKSIFSLSLNPQEMPKQTEKIKLFLQKRLNWGLRFFELHDDVVDENFIQTIRKIIPEDKLLFSSYSSKKFYCIKNKKNWSWDLKLGPPPDGVSILSLHERGQKDLKTLLEEFSSYKNYHLKLAVQIFDLQELQLAYEWYKKDPQNRSFLPRSQDGSWTWFRQVFGPKMFLHFIKERPIKKKNLLEKTITTQSSDQPFLSEAIPFIKNHKFLAGVLGYPIKFSASPAEHNDFFKEQRSIPFVAIPLKEDQMTKKNLEILKSFGFLFFAVTSPLKQRAFLCTDICDTKSQEFKSSNTLILHKKNWRAYNTDWDGLLKLKKYSSPETVVWGGGGTRSVLQKHLALANFYSARRGVSLSGEQVENPKNLIWAVGRRRMDQCCLKPPQSWKPSQVIDINYTQDSPGLEYAFQIQAEYQKGWDCFKEQARKQMEIFKELEDEI